MDHLIIVASSKDTAGLNIARSLIKDGAFTETREFFEGKPVFIKHDIKLAFIQRDVLEADHLDRYFDPQAFIFVSRHKSESGIPCLTAHFPGNFTNDTSFGGRERELGYTYPSLMANYMMALKSLAKEAEGYEVVVETTHHGPTSLKKPVLFVEVGSSEKEWMDERAIRTVSKALLRAIETRSSAEKIGIGFGGPHYSQKFTKAIVENGFGLGAIASKHVLPYLDDSIVDQMIKKCIEPVRYGVLDWKGLGQEKSKVLKLLEAKGLEVIRL